MNNIQTLLVIVVVALTALLTVVGIQVFLILHDTRKAVKRLNSILDDSFLSDMIGKHRKGQEHGQQNP